VNDRDNESEYGSGSSVFPAPDNPQRQPRTAAEHRQAHMAGSRGADANYTPRSISTTIKK
jgi:hypothetical protein